MIELLDVKFLKHSFDSLDVWYLEVQHLEPYKSVVFFYLKFGEEL